MPPRKKQAGRSDKERVERVCWLAANLWFGNKSQMASDLGFSHSAINRVVTYRRPPGSRLLAAIGSHPRVHQEWLLQGIGQPLIKSAVKEIAGDVMLPVAKRLLPGPIREHRDYLTEAYLPVLHRDHSPTRYWYTMNAVERTQQDLVIGDAMLIETDCSWLHDPKLVKKKFCAVCREPEAEPTLRRVSHYEPSNGVVLIAEAPLAVPVAPQYIVMGVHAPRRALLLKKKPTNNAIDKNAEKDNPIEGVAKPPSISPNEPRQSAVETESAAQHQPQDCVPLEAIVGVVVLLQRRWLWS